MFACSGCALMQIKKSYAEIGGEVKCSRKKRRQKTAAERLEGNTFTISNLGMFGIEQFTAIINSLIPVFSLSVELQMFRCERGKVVPGKIIEAHHVMRFTAWWMARRGAAFLQTLKSCWRIREVK